MNWRTTAVLFVIVLLLGSYLYYQSQQEPAPEPTPTPSSIPTPETVSLVQSATIDQVTELDIWNLKEATQTTYIREATGAWSQTVPTATVVLSPTLNAQVTGLINLVSTQTLPANKNPLSAYGLDAPSYKVVLTTQNRDDGPTLNTILIGNPNPTGDSYYVQKEGDDRVHVTSKWVIDNMINLAAHPPIPPTPFPTPLPILTNTVPISLPMSIITSTVQP